MTERRMSMMGTNRNNGAGLYGERGVRASSLRAGDEVFENRGYPAGAAGDLSVCTALG
jgi:hypothetical protein